MTRPPRKTDPEPLRVRNDDERCNRTELHDDDATLAINKRAWRRTRTKWRDQRRSRRMIDVSRRRSIVWDWSRGRRSSRGRTSNVVSSRIQWCDRQIGRRRESKGGGSKRRTTKVDVEEDHGARQETSQRMPKQASESRAQVGVQKEAAAHQTIAKTATQPRAGPGRQAIETRQVSKHPSEKRHEESGKGEEHDERWFSRTKRTGRKEGGDVGCSAV